MVVTNIGYGGGSNRFQSAYLLPSKACAVIWAFVRQLIMSDGFAIKNWFISLWFNCWKPCTHKMVYHPQVGWSHKKLSPGPLFQSNTPHRMGLPPWNIKSMSHIYNQILQPLRTLCKHSHLYKYLHCPIHCKLCPQQEGKLLQCGQRKYKWTLLHNKCGQKFHVELS